MSENFAEGRFELNADEIGSIVTARTPQIPRRVAQLSVESAKVLRVGPWIEEPAPPPPEDGSEPPPPPPPDVVTLAVTPQDSLVLLWLRQSEEADHLTEAVTLQYMLTRFNISVPPKIEFVMAASIQDLEDQSIEIVEGVNEEELQP
jgi:hypothetical protein